MTDVDTSDTKRYVLMEEHKQKGFAEIAEKPGGLGYLSRFGVVRGLDGKFYNDIESISPVLDDRPASRNDKK